MLSYPEALAAIAALPAANASEDAALDQALGRVLAEDVRLAGDQPPFDRATMDGYAVMLAGEATRFAVRGTVAAGQIWTGAQLQPGEAVRIMTGAPVPTGATVIPIELTDRGSDSVVISDAKALAPRRNIAWRGEDGRVGATVVAPGTRLGPATLAVAAMAGASQVRVARWPRLAVVTTGDEVGGAGAAGIADSNGPLLAALCASLGIPTQRRHARDDEAELHRTLADAARDAEIIVTTGGVSAGAKDLVPAIANALGFATVFHHVAIQPGKPVFLARHADGRCLMGLPGNPVSVLATAHLFLLPLLGRWLGGWAPGWLHLPLATAFQHTGKRHLFLPARLVAGGIEPIAWNGSGDLIAAAAGDGLVDLPVGLVATTGTRVRFLPYLGHAIGHHGIMPHRG